MLPSIAEAIMPSLCVYINDPTGSALNMKGECPMKTVHFFDTLTCSINIWMAFTRALDVRSATLVPSQYLMRINGLISPGILAIMLLLIFAMESAVCFILSYFSAFIYRPPKIVFNLFHLTINQHMVSRLQISGAC